MLNLPAQDAAPDTPDRLVWMPTKKDDTAPTAAARATTVGEAVDEYRRLLYVAMTRAADRLVICGSVGQNRRPEGCWYDLMAEALKPHCSEEPADVGEGTVLRYRKTPSKPETLSLFDRAAGAAGRPEPPGLAHARRAARGRARSRRSRRRSSMTRPRRSCAPAARRGGRRWRGAS